MVEITNFFLTLILNYGYPIIFLTLLLGYIGVPISLNVIVLAAGAFAFNGVLNIYLLFLLVVLTAIGGDVFNYYIGQWYGLKFLNFIGGKFGFKNKSFGYFDHFFNQWGDWGIFLTRWLLTPLATPLNVVAGSKGYSFKKYFYISVIGESIWSGGYLFLGYFFGQNWITVWDYINGAPQVLVLLFIGIFILLFAFNMRKK